MSNNILVVAAHPDDEILGCGATIAKHVKNGDNVYVLIMAEGLTSRDITRNRSRHENELSTLAETAHKANKLLGVKQLTLLDFPDNRMDGLELLDIIKQLEEVIATISPIRVYTHHKGDVNIDHQVTHNAVVTACRPIPGQCIKELLFFEVPSSTEWQVSSGSTSFTPNWFENVSSSFDKKLAALEVYAAEMRPWPHARSIKAVDHLAAWRGASIGCDYAEGFMLGRKIYD